MGREMTLTAAFYGALFFAIGVYLPFWPVWLEHWGLTPAEISQYLGLAIVARVVAAAVLPVIADRYAARRALLVLSALAAAALVALHPLIGSKAVMFIATLLTAAALAPLMPLAEALGVRASEMHGFPYARTRSAGSITFLAANLALGALIGSVGEVSIVACLAAALVLTAAIAPFHPGGGAPPGAVTADIARPGEALRLLTRPVFVLFTLAAAVGQSSHAIYYVYGSLDWARQEIAPGTIGALWATGVAVEIALLIGPGRRIVAAIGPARAIAFGVSAGVLRWGLMTVQPPEWALWPLQGLHALTFGLAHLGAMAFIAAAVPPRLAASAQGMFAGGIGGILMAAATFGAGGIVTEDGPLAPAYWLAAAMSAIAALAAMALVRAWDGGRLAE